MEQQVECNVCHFRDNFEKTADGLYLLPKQWRNMEDKTTDRTRPMVNVCSERCCRTLKEQNRLSSFRKKAY